MTADSYLIAHRVRGEAAFDIATRMTCVICEGTLTKQIDTEEGGPCDECDSLGYWWIIPTSGHRAFPYWYHGPIKIEPTIEGPYLSIEFTCPMPPMPFDLPDHYPTASTPSRTHDIAAILGLGPKPTTGIRRR